MRNATILCILMVLVTLAVYFQTAHHEFINFDDTLYVTDNPVVKGGVSPAAITWAFTTSAASNWHPVTWLSHLIDVQLFGLKPAGHHLMSVAIHAVSVLLLFLLLARITAAPWQSLFVAALFALHPLHVESVAWVAERKDVLSGLFWTLTLLLYARYVEKPGSGRYLAALACYAVGLMTKPMLVTLPVVLFLLDYWPLNRFTGEADHSGNAEAKPRLTALFKEKAPFFLLAALSSLITMYVQKQGGAMSNLEQAPIGLRISNAVISYAGYMLDAFWPHGLAMLYPFPTSILAGQLAGALLLLVLATVAVLYGRRRFPWLLTGWLWFLVTLLPVIGLIQVGGQSHADRYTYIPLTGLFIMVAFGVPQLLEGWRHRKETLCILAAVCICAMSAATWRQAGYWRNNITLYRHTLDVTSNNYIIMNNYGLALDQSGDLPGSMQMYQEALRVWPKSAQAHSNLAAGYARIGRFREALEHSQEALKIKPNYVVAMVNRGKALAGLGNHEEAVRQYELALTRDPLSRDAHLNLALLFLKTGRNDLAMPHYQEALRLSPHSPTVPLTVAVELAQQGRMDDAAAYFAQAVQIAPDSLEAHFNMGVFLAKQGRNTEAGEHFSRALRIRPDSAAARQWLERLGRSNQ